MISYFGKKVTKAYQVSQKAVSKIPKISLSLQQLQKQQNPIITLLRNLSKSKDSILPTTKLNQVAQASYEMQNFEIIVQFIFQQFHKDTQKPLRQYRNLFLIMSYLIKHGAGGFIDQFRDRSTQIESAVSLLDDQKKQARSVKQLCKHFIHLLNDKQKLLQQKQLAMLVKQKMKIYHSNRQNVNTNNESQQIASRDKTKVDNFLNNYLWKYTNKIDGKLQEFAQILATKVQKYLIDEIPQSFDIDQIQQQNQTTPKKTETDLDALTRQKQLNYVQQKNKQAKVVVTKNLLDLQ